MRRIMRSILQMWRPTFYLAVLVSYGGLACADGKIAFSSNREGNTNIFVMNPDGSDVTELTVTPGGEIRPSWSPDGSKIAFQSFRDGDGEIYIMNADGSNQRRLTTSPGSDGRPNWSPDGTKLVFQSRRSGETPITFHSKQDRKDFNTKIYVMNTDGSEQVQLTNIPGDDMHPSWSPDGSKIIFGSNMHGGITMIDLDKKARINLTPQKSDWAPQWSPDGTKIVFYSRHNGNRDIYVMNADGTNRVNLTKHSAEDVFPCWSPDGKKILFHSDRDGNNEIYIMDVDGTNLKNLTNHPSDDTHPSWSSH